MCLVLRQRIAVQFFRYLSILVIFIKCSLYILICECIWLFLSSSAVCLFFDTLYFSFFVFFNFSNVFSVYLNLRVYLFVLVFVVEVLFRFIVFRRNLLAGDVHSSVALDRHVNGQAASLYSLEVYSGHLPAHLRPEAVAVFSYCSQ